MQLQEIATLTQGAYISRLETSKADEEAIELDILTLKEFNETLGISYRMSDKAQTVYVKRDKVSKHLLTSEHKVIVHLLTQKAAVLPQKYSGLLIPTNFVSVELKEEADLRFIEWYFNEHPSIRKQISLSSQGTVISSLSIANLRELKVDLPPLDLQKRMGQIAILKRRKFQLVTERQSLEERLIHQQLINLMGGLR